ncbi:hypothetical protein D3C84_1152810 [compost metagenome]
MDKRRLRLEAKPGINQKDTLLWAGGNYRPDNLIRSAAQTAIECPVNIVKLRHKWLFNTVDGQHG